MTTDEISRTKILHHPPDEFIEFIDGIERTIVSPRFSRSSRNSDIGRKREKERERGGVYLGVEGENGSNVRSRVKGHGRWHGEKGLVARRR